VRLVRAALVRADGSVGPIQILYSEKGLSLPHVAFDGENYFVVWDDGDDGDYLRRLRGARVNRDGLLINSVPFDYGLGFTPAIGFDGTSYWIVNLQDQRGLVARRISRSGFETGDVMLLDARPGSPVDPALVCSEGTCLAAWYHLPLPGFSIAGAVLNSTGAGPLFEIARVGLVGGGPAIAANGNEFFVTWPDWNGHDDDIRGARVSRTGALLGYANVATTGFNEFGAAPVQGPFVVYGRGGTTSTERFHFRLFLPHRLTRPGDARYNGSRMTHFIGCMCPCPNTHAGEVSLT